MSTSRVLISLAVLIASVTATAGHAQDRRYIGVTEATVKPLFDGLFAQHRACHDEFEAVMCTTQMIVENGPHPLAPDPPEDGAWVHPIVAGRSQGEDDSGNEQVTVVDISGLSSQSDQGAASVGCSQPFSLFLQQGAIIRSGSQVPTFGVYFALADCFDDLPVACCGVYRPDRPADPPNVITPR